MWTHYTTKEIALSDLVNKDQEVSDRDSMYAKPKGLWISPVATDDNWEEWCRSEMPEWLKSRASHKHEVALDTTNILVIDDLEKFDAFHDRYKIIMPWDRGIMPDSALTRMRGINWVEIATEYKGIIISPYQYARRLGMETSWYYGWDCASGCIWDVSAIKGIKLLQREEA